MIFLVVHFLSFPEKYFEKNCFFIDHLIFEFFFIVSPIKRLNLIALLVPALLLQPRFTSALVGIGAKNNTHKQPSPAAHENDRSSDRCIHRCFSSGISIHAHCLGSLDCDWAAQETFGASNVIFRTQFGSLYFVLDLPTPPPRAPRFCSVLEGLVF